MAPEKTYDLICFDVDGTLIRHPTDRVIWEILNQKYVGTDRVNVERYARYRSGEISYAEWVELDVQGWIDAGATRDGIVDAVREFEHYDGVLDTVWELKRRGRKLAIISGTLDIVIDTLFPEHPFDDVFSNRLFFDADGLLSGWKATPYDLHGKPTALRELAGKHAIALERSAFVGDGENDVPIIGVAGLVVAFNPRSAELERRADHVLRDCNMRELLTILG